ncbi:hypothetical protein [Amorphus sp. 3PC139-8]|uniref:hypothetical protein n=1 Tax=Amorphus sp. 3PC139-8 TaxID=2735676 RepID=UPI00345E04F2
MDTLKARRLRALSFVSLLLAGGLTACMSNPDAKTPFVRAFGASCGEPCVLPSSRGGELDYFVAAAEEVNAGSKQLVIVNGRCASGCAVFADMTRDRVCLTDRARFEFHKASVYTSDLSERLAEVDPPHSDDILAWVGSQGGFPKDGLLAMGERDAEQFWRHCTPGELTAAGLPAGR